MKKCSLLLLLLLLIVMMMNDDQMIAAVYRVCVCVLDRNELNFSL